MKEIPLTQNKIAIVSDEDYDYVNQWKWCFHRSGYAVRTARVEGKQKTLSMHRVILERDNPIPEGKQVDHINMNRIDNRRENLRVVTDSQNKMNKKSTASSTSKYKGVSWHSGRNKWHTQIKINKKVIFLGQYDNEIEAAKVYDNKAIELFGEYATLNFPQEV
jgi:hypothetical protein